jgi:hypothetical protein
LLLSVAAGETNIEHLLNMRKSVGQPSRILAGMPNSPIDGPSLPIGFIRVLDEYPTARLQNFRGHELAAQLGNTLPQVLRKSCPNNLKVEGSPGKGKLG